MDEIMPRTKKEESEEIARHIQAYLDNGGKIKVITNTPAEPSYKAYHNLHEMDW